MEVNSKKNQEYDDYDYEDEEFVEDLEYVQAATLSELRKKILKKLDDGGTIETNPFLDTTKETPMWTQMILYYNYEEEEEEK